MEVLDNYTSIACFLTILVTSFIGNISVKYENKFWNK